MNLIPFQHKFSLVSMFAVCEWSDGAAVLKLQCITITLRV